MGIMVYSILWVMQDLYHQPYRSYMVNSLHQSPFLGSFVGTLPCHFGNLKQGPNLLLPTNPQKPTEGPFKNKNLRVLSRPKSQSQNPKPQTLNREPETGSPSLQSSCKRSKRVLFLMFVFICQFRDSGV